MTSSTLEPPPSRDNPKAGGPNGVEEPWVAAARRAQREYAIASVKRTSTSMLATMVDVLIGIVLVGLLVLASASVVAFKALIVVGAVGALVIVAVSRRPALGPFLLLATTPIVVGLRRGSIVPLLRLNEVLLFTILGAIALHVTSQWRRGRRARLANGTATDADWAIGLLVLAGSLLPLLVAYGRGRDVTLEDITHAFVFVKLGLLYLVFRYAIRTTEDVRRCIIISMVATIPVAFVGIAQSMQLPGVIDVLRPWLDQPPDFYVGRGAGTIGNAGAFGDVMAIHLAIAMAVVFCYFADKRDPATAGRPIVQSFFPVLAAAAVYAVGALGSGQFSGFAAAVIVFVVVAAVARRPQALLVLPLAGLVVSIALWPVIARRLEGFQTSSGIPPSWQGRLNNLNTFFLPRLREDFNWAIGVRPDTSLDNPLESTGQTFIESGFLWLLWAGGLALLAAYLLLMVVASRRFTEAARSNDPWLRVAGTAGVAATAFIFILTAVDPHLTLRGISDVYFPLLALSVLAARAPAVTTAGAAIDTLSLRVGWQRYSTIGALTKRALDIALSLVLLVLLSPLLLVIAVAVRATSPGPALFRQSRVGFGEQPFTIWKFRTMAVDNDETAHREFVRSMLRGELAPPNESSPGEDADSVPHAFKLADDPRVTRVGAFLRRTSLDELPQLLNVVQGTMSLVGPRPSLNYEVEDYLPQHRLRAMAIPGMTGLWQVAGRSELHMRDALDLDLRYIKTCSLRTDVVILAKTLRVVTKRSGL